MSMAAFNAALSEIGVAAAALSAAIVVEADTIDDSGISRHRA